MPAEKKPVPVPEPVPEPKTSVAQREPVRLLSLVNAAVGATVGVFTLTETISPELGGALAVALGAWIAVAGELLRSRVSPV